MQSEEKFTKDNIDSYLKELAKEYKKVGGKTVVELLIVGGGAVLLNYDFRWGTTDIDCDYSNIGSTMKECINKVGDRMGLPTGWLNDDFRKTDSYSPRLREFSKYYKTYSNIIEFRTMNAEYLIAMKLKSGRFYKKDISDIAGIVLEQQIKGDPITYDKVDNAVKNLYGDWSEISNNVIEVFNEILNSKDIDATYARLCENELVARRAIKEVEEKYDVRLTLERVDDIIAEALNRKNQEKEDENEKK